MCFGIRHVELILEQWPDAATCPNRVGVAEPGRTFFEKAFEFCELLAVEFRRSPRPRFGREGCDTVLFDKSPPKSDGRKTATKNRDDCVVGVTLFNQPSTLNAAVLEIRKFALHRAHNT